jgi:hypothetical protein
MLILAKIKNTKLIIRQDSADKVQLLNKSFLNEIKSKDVVDEEKDRKIQELEADIKKNTFDGNQILHEAKVIFPSIQGLSLSNNEFYYSNDSAHTTTILIYQSKKELNKEEKLKLENWLKQRLTLDRIELIRK